MNYGGFWIRFLAYVVDCVVVTIAVVVIGLVTALAGDVAALAGSIASFLVSFLYWPLMHASARQATYGKALLGLKVAGPDGGRLSFLRSLAREIAKLVSALPLMIGFILAAFTGRKQALHDFIASTTVVRVEPGHVVAGIAVTVLALFAPVLAVMFFGAGLVAGILGGMAGLVMTAPEIKVEVTPVPLPKPEATPPKPAATPSPPPVASSAEVEALLASRLSGIDKPGTAHAGPAVVSLDAFFTSSFWIKAHLPPMKQFDGRALLVLTRVLDKSGAELYDPKNALEEPFFQRVTFAEESRPVPHLAGTRQVSLKKGAKTEALDRVEGTLKLSVAVRPAAVAFAAADAGKQQTVHGTTLTLKSMAGKDVELHYSGEGKRLLSVRAYGKDGKQVGQMGMLPDRNDQQFKLSFGAAMARIEAVVAEGLVDRDFPFILTRTSVAGAPAASSAPAKPVVAQAEPPKPKPAAKAPAKPAVSPAAKELAREAAKPAAKEPATPEPAKAAPEPAPVAVETPKPAPQVVLPPQLRGPSIPGPRFNDLVTAVLYRDAGAVSELLAFGKWPDKADSRGVTPLMLAVELGDAAVAEALLKGGADPGRAMPVARERKDPAMTSLLERYRRPTSQRP